jgi:outer membrane protein OmpA-like peptidoglycan-associated protein/tetratricopeptide (TPR) repeat protein
VANKFYFSGSTFILKITYSYILLLLCFVGCKTSSFQVKDGKTAVELKLYNSSVSFLIKEFNVERDPNKQRDIAESIGDSYEKFNDVANAEKWYKQSADLNGKPSVLYKLAEMQKRQEKYDEAIRNFDLYQRMSGGAFEGKKQMLQCREAMEWKKAPTRITVTNLEINSKADDYDFVMFSKSNFVFTSTRENTVGDFKDGWTGAGFSDLFITEKNGASYSAPKSFDAGINSPVHESSVAFSSDFKEAYFIRCNVEDKSNQYCRLYFSNFTNNAWSNPIKMELFNDSTNVYDPCVSRDGTMLYFSSDATGGFGGTDLYVVSKTASSLGTPINLGSQINTPGSERFPWLDEKDNLYFSSNGLSGMGGLDIFRATKAKSGFREPVNLKYPINSGNDDFAYSITKYKPVDDKDTLLSAGYFTSNRPGGKGGDDIYSFNEIWFNEFILRINTYEKKYELPENPESKLVGLQKLPKVKIELKDNSGLGSAFVSTNDTGYYATRLGRNTFSYDLTASKNGYFTGKAQFSTEGKKTRDSIYVILNVDIELEKIFPQKEMVIPNIYYDYDKATLRPESMLVLDSILKFFSENPDLKIEIGSHTDSRGSDAYNLKLSQARAQSVVDYLIAKNVDAERLQAKGYGETKPVNDCVNGAKCSEEEFQKNRRTTFRVLSSKLNLESVEPENIRVDPKDK